jgi:hypothetical protein
MQIVEPFLQFVLVTISIKCSIQLKVISIQLTSAIILSKHGDDVINNCDVPGNLPSFTPWHECLAIRPFAIGEDKANEFLGGSNSGTRDGSPCDVVDVMMARLTAGAIRLQESP